MPANLSVPQADPIHPPQITRVGESETPLRRRRIDFSDGVIGGGVAPQHLDLLALATLDTRQSTMRKLDSVEGVAGSGVAPARSMQAASRKEKNDEVSPTHSHSEYVVFTLRTRKGQ